MVAPAGAAGTYTIQPGDKLWNIAEKVYGKGHLWTRISEANPSVDPSNLKVRTVLTIPPAPRAAATVAAGDDVTDLAPGYQTYTVRRRDTRATSSAGARGSGRSPRSSTGTARCGR